MSDSPLYGLRVVATGVLLLALCAVLGIAMFRSTLGPFTFGSELDAAPEWRVALWTTGEERERASSQERWNERLERRFEAAHWEALERDSLERGAVDLLIVDGARLDEEEARALRAFVERGGRLALFGARDAGGPPEAKALSALLGSVVRTAREYRWTLLLARSGPLTAGFSGSDRLPLRRAHGSYAIERAGPEVVWMPADTKTPAQGAAWRGRIGAGRLVWWSVRPDFALDRVAVQAAMTRVVRASVAWLLEEPFAEPLTAATADRAAIEAIEARVLRRSGGRFLLSVTNRGEAPSPALTLRVFLNRRVEGASVERTTVSLGRDGFAAPDYQLGGGDTELSIHSASLEAGGSRSYYLDLN